MLTLIYSFQIMHIDSRRIKCSPQLIVTQLVMIPTIFALEELVFSFFANNMERTTPNTVVDHILKSIYTIA